MVDEVTQASAEAFVGTFFGVRGKHEAEMLRIEQERQDLVRAFRAVFDDYDKSGTDASAVIAYLMRVCYFFDTTFDTAPDGKLDPLRSSFNEGKRSVVMEIMEFLTHPAPFAKLDNQPVSTEKDDE